MLQVADFSTLYLLSTTLYLLSTYSAVLVALDTRRHLILKQAFDTDEVG